MARSAYLSAPETDAYWREVEAAAYKSMNTWEEYKQQQQQNTQQQQSTNTSSNTVQCQKLGDYFNREIKTFPGMICPLGYLKVY